MTKQEMVNYLLGYLLKEKSQYKAIHIPEDLSGQESLLRALLNVRPPMATSRHFLSVQNDYLQLKAAERVVVFLNHLHTVPNDERFYVWKGDITRLKVDGIVNTASRHLLGCFKPLHNCSENAIHTYAGVQLRQDCYNLMEQQPYEEPTGTAKITPAYNLPAKFVLHTVSPNLSGPLTPMSKDLLTQTYLACLGLSEKNQLESVALPAINSSKDPHFVDENVAEVAVQTTKQFLEQSHFVKKVIFAVNNDKERHIYQKLLN